ncbi:MAG TPA: hypothetical protein DCY03_03910, partial [Planctomycetaceae bacterium]|nr:hypothetical protein [Planctomycetaceae bacterium]
KNDTPLVLWFVVVPGIHIFLVRGTNFNSLFYIVATDSLSIGFCLFICFALTFGKSVLVFCDNNSPDKDLDYVQFYFSVSRAIGTANNRLRDAMAKCDSFQVSAYVF